QLRRFRDCRPFEGFGIFFIISAPWFVAVSRAEPEFFRFFFIHEHLERYTSSVHQRKGSPVYFIPVLLLGMFPWVAALFQSLLASGKKLLARAQDYRLTLFLALWAAMIFFFFSVSGSKRPPYILPAIPPLCLLLAKYWDEHWADPARQHRSIFITAAALYAVFATAFALLHFYPILPLAQHPKPGLVPVLILALALGDLFMAWHRNTMRLLFRNLAAFGGLFILVALDSASAMDPLFSRKAQAEVLNRLAAPGDVVSTYHADYDRNCQSLSFYTARRVVIVGDEGELKAGSKLVPDTDIYFPYDEPYLKRYTGSERFFVIINKRRLRKLSELTQGRVYQLDNTPGPLALAGNRPPASY
ncbi:MAG: hypothetical protein GX410_03100, partial [Elusimicrobia bacterium]|nr:hypothetical protein [Elusimicrobiota bacterium]